MFERHRSLIALRGFMVWMGLALLAGCLPHNNNPAAAVPTNLVATAGNATVTLTWTASTGATGYNVKRSTTNGGPYTQIASPSAPTYVDTTVTNGTTYYYVVSSLNPGESANSAQVSATPKESPPAVPTNVAATAGNALVSLTWTASSGATSYNVKRSTTSGGPYTLLASVSSPSYSDATVTNGTTYYYVVSAVDSGGESANSAQVSATPQVPVAPAAPTNVAATAGSAVVNLSWSASTGATSYHVKRATTSGGPYTQIAAPTATSYADTSVTNGTTYYYVVSALNAVGESPNSTQVSAIPFVMNPPPTTFGTWINVTPSNVDLTSTLCGNYGSQTVQPDSMNPSNLYTQFDCQGIWKSTDYGATWTGPINTGTNGTTVADCGSGITVSPSSTAGGVPTVYAGCIRGNGTGFWKSVDGGVDWTNYVVVASANRQDYYPPVIDPYDPNHLLLAGHEFDSIVESTDGGQTWTNVPLASGMLQNGGTGFIFFINTGSATTTRGTWLWIAQQSGGNFGTWRTTNSGTAWVQVDKNEHSLGASQIYQPGTSGALFMAGEYSALGSGVLASNDFGQTWAHVGMVNNETVVVGTSVDVYAMFGGPAGPGSVTAPLFELASQPGTGTWVAPGTPSTLTDGAAQIGIVNDGTHNILVGAMWNAGVWRYVEP